jgi:predicted DNA-binding transcriptional regulator AlpA
VRPVAKVLKVSARTIDCYVTEGSGPPFVRIGRGRGQVRFVWRDVRAYLAGRREGDDQAGGGAQ